MHKASHDDIVLAGETLPDINLREILNPEGIEVVSFKCVKEISMDKEEALQAMLLKYRET